MSIPLENPSPDFETFGEVLRGKKAPQQVPFVELGVDGEVVRSITEDLFGEKWVPSVEENEEEWWKQLIRFYYRLGYDYVTMWSPWTNLPQFKERRTQDTATLSRGERSWIEEGGGIIKNWEEFHRMPWDQIGIDLRPYEIVEAHLPEGMKIMASTTLFEMILERFMGYEDLFYLVQDDPELVKAIFDAWGRKVQEYYEQVIGLESVGGIFHADDLGYKTATMLRPQFLREVVFPWFKKYADLAHEYGKMYWYHCCGNVSEVMEDLIEDVKIDAFHSFQDVIIPVSEFKKRYGDRIAVLGGIDMDVLARAREGELRGYVRQVLDTCMPGGRYALGSGNTAANYVPVKNYLAMLDEGWRYHTDGGWK